MESDFELFLRSPAVRKYCLNVFHRYIESGNLHHEAVGGRLVGNLLEYLERTRSRLHKEAIEFIVEEGLSEAEAKKILTAECERMVAGETQYAQPKPRSALSEGQAFCGCCREMVTDIAKHRNTPLHKEIEREALIIHTGAFPMVFLGVWQCQVLADRVQKIMESRPDGR